MTVVGIFEVARNQGPGGPADLSQSLEFYVRFLYPLVRPEEIVTNKTWNTGAPEERSMARAGSWS